MPVEAERQWASLRSVGRNSFELEAELNDVIELADSNPFVSARLGAHVKAHELVAGIEEEYGALVTAGVLRMNDQPRDVEGFGMNAAIADVQLEE